MVQDVGQQGQEPEEAARVDSRTRSGLWPWVVLAVVVLLVILLLWLYWRQPPQGAAVVIRKSSEIPVVAVEPRPEPVVPTASGASVEETAVARVPDVLGDPRSSAVRTLEGAGYEVTTSKRYTSSRAAGLVVRQDPAGGAPLDVGGTVAIAVSAGTPTSVSVSMPEIVGLTQSAAETKVRSAGLVPYLTYGNSGISEGHVISQWPLSGESVPRGSEGFIQVQLSR